MFNLNAKFASVIIAFAGDWSQYTTHSSMGRQSKKIVIEYDVTEKSK